MSIVRTRRGDFCDNNDGTPSRSNDGDIQVSIQNKLVFFVCLFYNYYYIILFFLFDNYPAASGGKVVL